MVQSCLHAYVSLLDLSSIKWSSRGKKGVFSSSALLPCKIFTRMLWFLSCRRGNAWKEKLPPHCCAKKCAFFCSQKRQQQSFSKWRANPSVGNLWQGKKTLFFQDSHLPLEWMEGVKRNNSNNVHVLQRLKLKGWSAALAVLQHSSYAHTLASFVWSKQIKCKVPTSTVMPSCSGCVDGHTGEKSGQAKSLGV